MSSTNEPSHPSHQSPPEGFAPHFPPGPFMQRLGPLFSRPEPDGTMTVGLRLTQDHVNHQSSTHGGMLAAMADHALGFNTARVMGAPIATVHLSVDFLGRSSVGEWLELVTRIDRRGRRMCFVQCTASAEGRQVMRATGVFSVISLGSGA